jgi:hypothetical protein
MELLNYKNYIVIAEKLYKIRFFFYSIICLNATLNLGQSHDSFNIIRRALNTIYYYPIILHVTALIAIVIELLWFKKLYFCYYILFWLPVIFGCCKGLNALGRTFLIIDVSMLDYRRKNLAEITYKPVFWRCVEMPEVFFGFSIDISEQEYAMWEIEYLKNVNKDHYYSYELIERLFKKVNTLQEKHPYNIFIYFSRVKVAYYKLYKIRWNYKNKTHEKNI